MSRWIPATRRLISYSLFFGLALLMGCENWNLGPINASLTAGLVAYYPFNGNTLDESGNNLNGRTVNGATYGPDRNETSQSALLLDGVDDYFEIADNARLRPDSISISLWFKPRQVDSTAHIYNKSNYADHQNQQYSAFIRPPKSMPVTNPCCEIYFDVNNDGLCTIEQPIQNPVIYYDPTFKMNRWYHMVTVFTGQTNRLYINGQLKRNERELTNNPIDKCVGSPLRFGAQADFDPNYFDGMMDEIRIYNRGLTQTEINALYNR